MKILYLAALFPPYVGGGAEIVLEMQAQGMAARGHEVVVLTTGPKPGMCEEQCGNIKILRVSVKNIYWQYQKDRPSGWKRAVWHLRDIYNVPMANMVEDVVLREKPDVVCCHNLVGWSAAVWDAIKRAGVPVVQVLHDLYNLCPSSNMFSKNKACRAQCGLCKSFRFYHPHLSDKVDAVVGVSHFVLDRHLQAGYFSKSRIRRVIYNARELEKKETDAPGIRAKDTLHFGYIGSLSPAKGVELLLGKFVEANLINATLDIAGVGNKTYVKQLQEKYCLDDRVRFLGYVKPNSFFPLVDVLVVPSLCQEAFGLVIVEAFSFGIPVIASRRGGIPEAINDGLNGYLFEPEDSHQLVDLLRKIAGDPQCVLSMRGQAAKSAELFSNVDGWLDEYEGLFNELRLGY